MIVDLDSAEMIGRGSSRVCYVHPGDALKCIKITYVNNASISREELRHYRRFSRRRISWDMMSRTYGHVRTTLGEGVVFSLSRDYNGSISRTLEYYLQNSLVSPDLLAGALNNFKRYLIRERIVVRELKADNLVYQRLTPLCGKIVIIDGVGNNEFLPLANYSSLFARRTVRRKWGKFRRSFPEHYSGNRTAEAVASMLHDELGE